MEAIEILSIVCVVLGVGIIFLSFWLWKVSKANDLETAQLKEKQKELEEVLKDHDKTIDYQSQQLDTNEKFQQEMAILALAEQEEYLQEVVLRLNFLVNQNSKLMKFGRMPLEIGTLRNNKLLVLKGSIAQQAEALSLETQEEMKKISISNQ